MKHLFCLLLLTAMVSVPAIAAEVTSLENDNDKISYAVGMNIGNMLRAQEFNLDLDTVVAGLSASFQGQPGLMSESEMGLVLNDLNRQLQEKAMEEQAAKAEENLQNGKEFLAANAKADGVETLESGLQYKVVVKGEGESPTLEDTVKVHYRGMHIDGTEFDSSYKLGQPAEFKVEGVIPGWVEVLQLMHVGDKLQVTIPPELAYGETGAPPVIEPNSVLLFELELVEIVK